MTVLNNLELSTLLEATQISYLFPTTSMDTEDTIVKEEFGQQGDRLAKQATLVKLIERITTKACREFEFVSDLLLTLPMFSSNAELLALLSQR
jgi:hypothetical protein